MVRILRNCTTQYRMYSSSSHDCYPFISFCRKDLRKECIFTIDPATARDLDDALHCTRLENGEYIYLERPFTRRTM